MADLNFDLIAANIREAGHPAFVEYTGGGCATLHIGTPYADENGDNRFPVIAGPGWFDGNPFGPGAKALGSTDEFCWGVDDDGATDNYEYATDADDNDTLTRKILARLTSLACSCNDERPGDCRSMGCDPDCKVC